MNVIELLFKADTKELNDAKDKLHGLGSEMPNVGQAIEGLLGRFKAIPGVVGLAVAALVGLGLAVKGMIENTLAAQERMLDLSEAMGLPIERAQPFIAAMELVGVTAEKLQNSLGKLSQNVTNALSEPTGKAADAFRQLGISQEELANGDIEQILRDTSLAFGEYAESAQKTAAMRDLFGKQGPQIVNEMQNEAEMTAMAAAAQRDYGTAISQSDAEAAKYFGITLKQGMTMFEGVGFAVTKTLLPGLQELVNQFAASGRQGGFLRDILDGLAGTIGVVAKVILTLLVEPVRLVVTVFKEAGTMIGGTLAAISAAAQGNFSEAKDIIHQTGLDMADIASAAAEDMLKFETALWSSGEAVVDTGDKVEEATEQWVGFSNAAQQVSETLAQLTATYEAQLRIEEAASESLEDYKIAQDSVAISTMRLKLEQQGATEAEIRRAEGLMLSTAALKQRAADEVAGWNLINKLASENAGIGREQLQLQRDLEEIARRPGMTQAQREEATALAEKNHQLRQEARLKEEISQLDAGVERSINRQIAGFRLGANQLRLYNEELRLKEQHDRLVAKDPANAEALTKALEEQIARLREADAAVQKYKSSWEGLKGGASKAMQEFASEVTNLNQIGQDLTSKFLNGAANAFVKMKDEGKSAWRELGKELATYVETVLVKFALLQGAIVVMKALGVSPETIDAILGAGASSSSVFGKGSAKGNVFSDGSIQQFANGGVVAQETFFNIGSMAEEGPEAIMPLARDGSGRLGVRSASGGDAGGRGAVTHYHAPQITIISDQDPYDIAKQTKKTLDMHEVATTRKIQKESRPGGMFRSQRYGFAGA